MTRIGPLLVNVLAHMAAPSDKPVAGSVMAMADIGDENDIAVVIRLPHEPSPPGTKWEEYRARTLAKLTALQQSLDLERDSVALIAGRSLQARVTPDEAKALEKRDLGINVLELDPLMPMTLLDQVPTDIDFAPFKVSHPDLDGSGVTVAVLDSGIDSAHPALTVADGVAVCDESLALPGDHGTHCAGSIASSDAIFRGIAPGVKLLNIKVLSANGSGKPNDIARGVDAALDKGAEILSMSVGSNHLPIGFVNANGWVCPDGACQMCMAVDNAVLHDGALAIVAAGNDHGWAQALRDQKRGSEFDTELSCPGQARAALTVGAITKGTWTVGPFSSCGPTSYGTPKPDLAAPGVQITSTIAVPRDPHGNPLPNSPRVQMFASKSGTSMATPIVAGLAALVAQRIKASGQPATPAAIRQQLLAAAASLGTGQENITGAGRARAT